MRVSNVHHETAVWSLFVLQEIEPKTYERLVARIQGIDMAGKMGIADYFPSELPSMFGSWKEYRDYLLENLITNAEHRASFYKSFGKSELDMGEKAESSGLYRAHVSSIMCNDWMGGKLANFMAAPQNYAVAKANRHARKKLESAENAADAAFNREETEA
jgi:predicted phosphoadenosine phosphosulfate sulfurtransferase